MSGLSTYRLVLVSPRIAGNVGACARLAANFDCPDWILVSPQCEWDSWDARKYATGSARETFDRVRVVASVEEAVRDCQAAIGFTRRHGKGRRPSLSLAEVPTLTSTGARTALVFGNEETGLTSEELDACTHTCSFPVSEAMPSMNLSHAVAVALSRVFEAGLGESQSVPARMSRVPGSGNLGELQEMMEHWRELLVDIGMTQAGNPDRMVLTLRKIFERAALKTSEMRAIRGVLSKAQVKLGTRIRGSRSKS